jgi:hypothetical protein
MRLEAKPKLSYLCQYLPYINEWIICSGPNPKQPLKFDPCRCLTNSVITGEPAGVTMENAVGLEHKTELSS